MPRRNYDKRKYRRRPFAGYGTEWLIRMYELLASEQDTPPKNRRHNRTGDRTT